VALAARERAHTYHIRIVQLDTRLPYQPIKDVLKAPIHGFGQRSLAQLYVEAKEKERGLARHNHTLLLTTTTYLVVKIDVGAFGQQRIHLLRVAQLTLPQQGVAECRGRAAHRLAASTDTEQ
jgi:hypothetical protein